MQVLDKIMAEIAQNAKQMRRRNGEVDLEHVELADLEQKIEKGLATFVEVGLCLLEIRDRRLYRCSGYTNFEDYCRERWGWSRFYVHRQIEAAKVAEILLPIGNIPANEAQARELAPLLREDEQAAIEVWRELKEKHGEKLTAEKVREAVDQRLEPAGRNIKVHFSSERTDWETPDGLFEMLDSEFRFGLDVCATEENAKCERYFSPEINGLKQAWSGVCWMNPPYGDEIYDWMEKAFAEARKGCTVVCLIPSRTDTSWWHEFVMKAHEIRFIWGRVKFAGSDTSAPFPSAVVVFKPSAISGYPKISSLKS